MKKNHLDVESYIMDLKKRALDEFEDLERSEQEFMAKHVSETEEDAEVKRALCLNEHYGFSNSLVQTVEELYKNLSRKER
mmetsp:Transcript_7800/g.12091  ORF Transcript_7800/g.12091 Transcript_7800/m.12091 type:complete len:80 (+) Transcript_7800:1960-2199(+)